MVRKIVIQWPKDQNKDTYTIVQWIKTLPTDQQTHWQQLRHEHEAMVAAAKSCGDAWTEGTADRPEIFWKSPEIHDSWMAKIPRENHTAYLAFWQKFEDHCQTSIDRDLKLNLSRDDA